MIGSDVASGGAEYVDLEGSSAAESVGTQSVVLALGPEDVDLCPFLLGDGELSVVARAGADVTGERESCHPVGLFERGVCDVGDCGLGDTFEALARGGGGCEGESEADASENVMCMFTGAKKQMVKSARVHAGATAAKRILHSAGNPKWTRLNCLGKIKMAVVIESRPVILHAPPSYHRDVQTKTEINIFLFFAPSTRGHIQRQAVCQERR